MNACIVIPARLESTRLPHKLLLKDTGKPLIQHTYENLKGCNLPIVVATDSEEIAKEVRRFNGEVVMTGKHDNGTERVAEVAKQIGMEVIVNVQGDEPEISPHHVHRVIARLRDNIATLAAPISLPSQLKSPTCVKVVLGMGGRALYFSRGTIPHWQDMKDHLSPLKMFPRPLQHLGIYAYRRNFLLDGLPLLAPTALEKAEGLEQLRFLAWGETIHVGVVSSAPIAINTREEYDAFVSRFKNQNERRTS